MFTLKRSLVALLTLAALHAPAALAQPDPGAETDLYGPVTALWADTTDGGLVIGQGTRLVRARPDPNGGGLAVDFALDLGSGEIRDAARAGDFLLALTEDSLLALDASGNVTDLLPGGGQRIAAADGRAYIAARQAGVRILAITPDGKLARLGGVATLGPALDVWLDVAQPSHLWVAEGQGGVRLYDVADPETPQLALELPEQAPALLVRADAARLYVAHGGELSALDRSEPPPAAPRFLGTLSIDPPAPSATGQAASAQIADLAVVGSRIFAARAAPDGADLVEFELIGDGPLRLVAGLGQSGAGEHMALLGDALFIGSVRGGLQWVNVGRGNPVQVMAWGAPTVAPAEACEATEPEPADLAVVESEQVTLSWRSDCPEGQTLTVNGARVPAEQIEAVPGDDGRFAYTFRPGSSLVAWSVDGPNAGSRLPWRFNVEPPAWTATPPAPEGEMLYRRPLLDVNLASPAALIGVTCLSLCSALVLITGAAWLLGQRVQRRDEPRL
ncbi:MAG: hypothetical protein IT323_06990 [Anaerolineae bacterium]|nr:hypothetical protein [Anaerolineae bacterium]